MVKRAAVRTATVVTPRSVQRVCRAVPPTVAEREVSGYVEPRRSRSMSAPTVMVLPDAGMRQSRTDTLERRTEPAFEVTATLPAKLHCWKLADGVGPPAAVSGRLRLSDVPPVMPIPNQVP